MFITRIRQILAERADNDVLDSSNSSSPKNPEDDVSIKPTVENIENPDFEPIEKQRHFGILHYTINNRFRKIMLITIVNVIFVVGAFILVFFTFLKVNEPSTDIYTTVQPSTRALQTTTCSPTDDTTFLFAYSTDLDSGTVNETLDYFSQHTMFPPYTTFATVRFDMKRGVDFYFDNNFNSTTDYVRMHPPNPSLGFGNSNNGSDLLTIIDNFIANDQVPVCGSRLLILVKRYPKESEISTLVIKLREYHITPSILASNSPSGGDQPKILYDLATQTNGLCGFYDDETIGKAVGFVPSCFNPFLIYAANPIVVGKGTMDLPVLHVATNNFFWFTMTIQNYGGPTSEVKTVLLKWTSTNSENGKLGKDGGTIHGFLFGNVMNKNPVLNSLLYNLTLNYEYSDGNERRLQIRVHSTDPVNSWVPFDN
ncbi:unnamed protein product [Caenorhabditis brenneri]